MTLLWNRSGEPRPATAAEIAADLAPPGGPVLCCLLPSYLERCSAAEHRAGVRHVVENLAAAAAAHPGLTPLLVAGLQHVRGAEGEARARLAELGAAALAGTPSVDWIGLTLAGSGKRRTINAALRLCVSPRVVGWLWIDDDVRLDPECLPALLGRFLERGCTGAVGATVLAQSTAARPSRWLRGAKSVTAPRRLYPQACCMVVASRVLAGGLSPRRFSDDGFVFFELLDPARDDPYADLEVLPAARCTTIVGGGWRDTLRNQRRTLYSHILLMADYPAAKGRYYFRHSLFFGLWPLAPWDRRLGAGAALRKWLVKAALFAWFVLAAGGLALRGLLNRPLRSVAWGAYARYRLPS